MSSGGAAIAADAPPAANIPPALRFDEALVLARERGLDLLVAQAAVASAEGDVAVAGAIPNPALSASYGRSFTYGSCPGCARPCAAWR